MRIIGYIEHPSLKITVFKMDNRLSVKFESGLYEQIYKFRQGEGMETLADIQALVDDTFCQEVQQGIQTMHNVRTRAISRKLPQPDVADEFEEII